MSEPDPDRIHNDHRLAATFLGLFTRPRRTFAALAVVPQASPGASAIALLGIVWGMLCLLLWNGGHEPRFLLVPAPPEHWYLIQGLLSLPLLTALWWLFSEAAHRLARAAGGTGAEPGVRAALGFAYAGPMLLHIGAELAGFLAGGMSGLSAVARISMPVAAVAVWVLSTLALMECHKLRVLPATGAAFAGLLLQALVGALVLR
ncbi:MAG: hypothetical protein AB8I08_36730 [Sandaracinaceae bacterium]